VVGPEVVARIKPAWLLWLADHGWLSLILRLLIVAAVIGVQLLAYHLWLAAGHRRVAEVWPGVLLSIVLWLLAAQLFGSWLAFSNYSRFYAGLASMMAALVFFQISAVVILLGAEINRGLIEIRNGGSAARAHARSAK
jgi:membrane protein